MKTRFAGCPALLIVAMTVALTACAVEESAPVPIGVKAAALASCSSTGATSELAKVQVIVRHLDVDGTGSRTFKETYSYNSSGSLKVSDVPQGQDEEVTVIGLDALGDPILFGRQSNTLIEEGQVNDVTVALSNYGGFSCPSGASEYTHRIFPSLTSIGNGRYLVAGGLTTVDTTSVTSFDADDGSRKAWIYDSKTGKMSKVNSLMNNGRAAHSAVFVPGAETNQVILFGGTREMKFNPADGSGFGWTFDTNQALKSVEVLEWNTGELPETATFRQDVNTQELYRKRVWSSANVVSNDGLVLVCGGGVWGASTDPDYNECDVWDALSNEFILANVTMGLNRAGHSAAVLSGGGLPRLLFVGGTTGSSPVQIYKSSSEQRSGNGGNFLNYNPAGMGKVFHHSLTPMGDGRFAVIGGVIHDQGSFQPPSADSAWILTVNQKGADDYEMNVQAVGGLGVGRYFHTAQAPSGKHLTILGGFTGMNFTAVSEARYYDEGQGGLVALAQDELPVARGGMTSLLMENDTLLLVGGIGDENDLTIDEPGVIEVYTPSSTPLYR